MVYFDIQRIGTKYMAISESSNVTITRNSLQSLIQELRYRYGNSVVITASSPRNEVEVA